MTFAFIHMSITMLLPVLAAFVVAPRITINVVQRDKTSLKQWFQNSSRALRTRLLDAQSLLDWPKTTNNKKSPKPTLEVCTGSSLPKDSLTNRHYRFVKLVQKKLQNAQLQSSAMPTKALSSSVWWWGPEKVAPARRCSIGSSIADMAQYSGSVMMVDGFELKYHTFLRIHTIPCICQFSSRTTPFKSSHCSVESIQCIQGGGRGTQMENWSFREEKSASEIRWTSRPAMCVHRELRLADLIANVLQHEAADFHQISENINTMIVSLLQFALIHV